MKTEAPDAAATPSAVHGISAWMAAMHLIRSNLGAGVLNLPSAFCVVGSIWGSAITIAICAQGVYCMYSLAEVKLLLAPNRAMTFADLTMMTLGRTGYTFTQICIFGLQAGCCVVFIQLASVNVLELSDALPIELSTLTSALVAARLDHPRRPRPSCDQAADHAPSGDCVHVARLHPTLHLHLDREAEMVVPPRQRLHDHCPRVGHRRQSLPRE